MRADPTTGVSQLSHLLVTPLNGLICVGFHSRLFVVELDRHGSGRFSRTQNVPFTPSVSCTPCVIS
jgi:hypothetical protein